MGFGELLDGAIAPFAPGWALRRSRERAWLSATLIGRERIDGLRRYDAAGYDRRTSGWDRTRSGVDRENQFARGVLAAAGHDLVRNNKYAAAAVRQLTATIWGDGITAQAVHSNKRVQQQAQDDWDRWAESKVDDLGDWYGYGKVSTREMIVGGESLTVWKPSADEPDARVVGMEGAQLDDTKTYRVTNGKIVSGVQFDTNDERVAYWLYDEHPQDLILGSNLLARPVAAQHVDHLFERLRHRQTRGVSWLGAVAMTLRDLGDIEDAKRLQAKVQACLALIIEPGDGLDGSPLGEQATPPGETADSAQPLGETMRPGMIARLRAGEKATVINPVQSADMVAFIRQQLAGVSANMVPYHLMTGDVSQANYSSLRAGMNGLYTNVDDWQQNQVIGLMCAPAFRRRMIVSAMKRNDPRFLQVRASYALPVRRMVDPIKDLMGEIMEIRAGLKTISKGLAERGINADEHLREIARMNGVIDELKLALDSDPRRLTDSGILQAAAPYLHPQSGAANNQGV